MNEAVAIARLINGAFALIATFRRFVGTNDEIKARFDTVDAGGDAVSVAEVQAKLDDFQAAIDEGRNID